MKEENSKKLTEIDDLLFFLIVAMDAIRTVIIFSPVSEKYIGSADLASFSLVLSSSVIISTLMFGFIEQSYERGYGVSETLNKIVNTGIPIILLIFLGYTPFKGQTLFEINDCPLLIFDVEVAYVS